MTSSSVPLLAQTTTRLIDILSILPVNADRKTIMASQAENLGFAGVNL